MLANEGIEASFGSQALERFQDLVTKIFAVQHTGTLGQRGAVPGKDTSKLHITNVVRGSFGFRLEEMSPQTTLLMSPLKEAVDEATRLMERFGEGNEESFESEVEDLDGRVFATIREFFKLLSDNKATFRLVSGNLDKSFRSQSIIRAAERAKITELDEKDIHLPGQLLGALRVSRIFEFRPEDESGTIKGFVSSELSADTISQINREFSDQDSLAMLRVKTVLQNGRVMRQKFTLLSIERR